MSNAKQAHLVFVGMGAHARVLLDFLQTNYEIAGAIDHGMQSGEKVLGISIYDEIDMPIRFPPTEFLLVNAVGMGSDKRSRKKVSKKMRALGYKFLTAIHPTAIVSKQVRVAEGVQIMAGVILQPGVDIGQDSIVNTGAKLDHDCRIGEDCHICPGTIIAGSVGVGAGSFIGAGVIVTPGIRIGDETVIGAGSVIFQDVPDFSKVIQRRAEIPQRVKEGMGKEK